MSRIGVKAIVIPTGVKVNVTKSVINVEGPKGKLEFPLNARVEVVAENGSINVKRSGDSRADRAMHGMTRAMIANMIQGVSEGYEQKLEMIGVGYRAQLQGKKLVLQLGFSHPVDFPIPEGITVEAPKPTNIIVKGINKQRVGQVAANIRSLLPPEPYKGKGIRYAGEQVRRKAGKAMAK